MRISEIIPWHHCINDRYIQWIYFILGCPHLVGKNGYRSYQGAATHGELSCTRGYLEAARPPATPERPASAVRWSDAAPQALGTPARLATPEPPSRDRREEVKRKSREQKEAAEARKFGSCDVFCMFFGSARMESCSFCVQKP